LAETIGRKLLSEKNWVRDIWREQLGGTKLAGRFLRVITNKSENKIHRYTRTEIKIQRHTKTEIKIQSFTKTQINIHRYWYINLVVLSPAWVFPGLFTTLFSCFRLSSHFSVSPPLHLTGLLCGLFLRIPPPLVHLNVSGLLRP